MLSLFETIAVLLTVTAAFSWFNARVLHLPNTIGLLIMSLGASVVLVIVAVVYPGAPVFNALPELVRRIDFAGALLNGMLAFLLFAGALHVNISVLRERAVVVGLMATFGVVISTLAIAPIMWAAAQWLGTPLPFAWALVFGALISPTDPIAVLSTLREVKVPHTLEMDMTGESLFNDGVGVVLFVILVTAAESGGQSGQTLDIFNILELFAQEAFGGIALGIATGFIAYYAMRKIDDYPIEILITLALVTGTYAIANHVHVSGPIAVVVNGLFIGNRGAAFAMSDTTHRYLFGFWNLIDQLLNSVLFLMIGLEVVVLKFDLGLVPLAGLAVPIVLFGRFCAVALPVMALSRWKSFIRGTIPVLTWGGVRGGISVALALALPEMPYREMLLAATYTVAVWTIILQGLTLALVIRRLDVCGAQQAEA